MLNIWTNLLIKLILWEIEKIFMLTRVNTIFPVVYSSFAYLKPVNMSDGREKTFTTRDEEKIIYYQH